MEGTGRGGDVEHKPFISVVTPAFREAENLPLLYQRLRGVLEAQPLRWEWLIVDDHSPDETFAVASRLSRIDQRVRVMRLSRNGGSHTALACGLHHALGHCAVAIAGDLQDPPEVIPALVEEWRKGAQVVWAVRGLREGASSSTLGFARIYYFLMRRIVGLREMPASGADFFLLDRAVLNAFREFREAHVSVLALLSWMGFYQVSITYDKQARLRGHSGWTLEKKIKLVLDSVTAFTYLPVRLISYLGAAIGLLGFLYAGLVVVNALFGNPTEGWSSLMVVILLLSGMQMLMMGVLGEYMWRALDESRRRPRYLIEACAGAHSPMELGPAASAAPPPPNDAA